MTQRGLRFADLRVRITKSADEGVPGPATMLALAALALATAASSQPAPAPDAPAAFQKGQADRRAWESWVAAQAAETLAGAEFWAAHRSSPAPPSCTDQPGASGAWTAGCEAARARLAGPDRARQASADYRRGWNSPLEPTAPAGGSPATVASPPPPAPAGPVSAALVPAPSATPGATSAKATDVGETPIATAPASRTLALAAPPEAPRQSSWPLGLFLVGVSILFLGLAALLYLVLRPRTRAEDQLRTLLLPGEQVVVSAMQHRLSAGISRRNLAAATTGRFIVLRRHLLGGYAMTDVRWQDLKQASLSVGAITASVRLAHSANLSDTAMDEANFRTLTATGLVIAGAQAVYRECQAQEQAWREKRRVRAIEEMRARAGGVQVATGVYSAGQTAADALAALPSSDSVADKLAKARDLRLQGLITDSEYESIKARLVQSI